MHRREFLASSVAITASGITTHAARRSAKDESIYNMGSRRELFLDNFLIEKTRGKIQFQLHHPQPRELVLHMNDAWEGTSSGYMTMVQDGDKYFMYYRGHNFDLVDNQIRFTVPESTCVAISDDGINFNKPKLGLYEHDGSKENNIIWRGAGAHNFSPFLDTRPDCPAEERFKAFGGLRHNGGMRLFKSPDGVHWSAAHKDGVITNGAFDSANIGFWDPTIEKYRAYWRYFTEGITEEKVWKPAGIRAIRTAVSDDLKTWTDFKDLRYTDSPDQQMYTNNVIPYYRAPHILLGFPMRYIERGWSPSMRALPDLEKREFRAAAHIRYGTALTETQIMSSRDGVLFDRVNEAFLRPGVQRPDSWYYAHNEVAWNIATTKSSLPGAPDEMAFYASAGRWHGEGSKLIRHTIRQDGFRSVGGTLSGGEIITRPLTFDGKRLDINFSTSAAGTVKVEIQTVNGQPIEGFTLEDADEVFGDELDRSVTWNGKTDVSELAGKPIRLRITLSDADLYAVKFSA